MKEESHYAAECLWRELSSYYLAIHFKKVTLKEIQYEEALTMTVNTGAKMTNKPVLNKCYLGL